MVKRPRNLQLGLCVGPSHQESNTHAHTHTNTHTQSFPFQLKPPSDPCFTPLLRFYSSILHLSFSNAHSERFTFVHLFFPLCASDITHCLPWTFVPTNLSKQKDRKDIKVSKAVKKKKKKTLSPLCTQPHQEGADLARKATAII